MPPHTSNPASACGAETGPGALRLVAEDTREITVSLPDLQVLSLRRRYTYGRTRPEPVWSEPAVSWIRGAYYRRLRGRDVSCDDARPIAENVTGFFAVPTESSNAE